MSRIDWKALCVPEAEHKHGAPMGRYPRGEMLVDCGIFCRKLNLHQGYDEGGAYWGSRERGMYLYCVYNRTGALVYVDAPNRADALRQWWGISR